MLEAAPASITVNLLALAVPVPSVYLGRMGALQMAPTRGLGSSSGSWSLLWARRSCCGPGCLLSDEGSPILPPHLMRRADSALKLPMP